MEGHTLLEGECVAHAVFRRLPLLGQERSGIGRAGLGADEALEDLAGDAEGLTVLRERGVEAGRVGRRREDERAVDVAGCSAVAVAALAGDAS